MGNGRPVAMSRPPVEVVFRDQRIKWSVLSANGKPVKIQDSSKGSDTSGNPFYTPYILVLITSLVGVLVFGLVSIVEVFDSSVFALDLPRKIERFIDSYSFGIDEGETDEIGLARLTVLAVILLTSCLVHGWIGYACHFNLSVYIFAAINAFLAIGFIIQMFQLFTWSSYIAFLTFFLSAGIAFMFAQFQDFDILLH